jgi:primosomal protein N'
MDLYRLQMLLKIKPTQSLAAVRKGLKQSLAAYYQRTTDHSLRVELDMDPR